MVWTSHFGILMPSWCTLVAGKPRACHGCLCLGWPGHFFKTSSHYLGVVTSSYGLVMENRIIQIIEEGDNDKWGISHSPLICSFQGTWTAQSFSTQDTTDCFRFQRAVPWAFTGLHSLTLFRGWIIKWLTAMPQNTVWQQREIVCWHTWHKWIIRALITW